MQIPLFKPQTEWVPPTEFPDLSHYDEIAIDLETKDPNLNTRMGSGSVIKNGDVTGISLATKDWCAYYPIAHEGGGNMDRKKVLKWSIWSPRLWLPAPAHWPRQARRRAAGRPAHRWQAGPRR